MDIYKYLSKVVSAWCMTCMNPQEDERRATFPNAGRCVSECFSRLVRRAKCTRISNGSVFCVWPPPQ